MVLALAATALVVLALTADVLVPRIEGWWQRMRARRQKAPALIYDPGRERRAEQTARELLHSCVGEEEWEMYRDLGFIRVWGAQADGPGETGGSRGVSGGGDGFSGTGGAAYAYLVYPHRPIVAYLAQTHRLLGEYCVTFPDESRPYGSARLPDSDDALAKWMALTGDERRLIASANMHLPGRQLDPDQVRRDLWRLGQWERRRVRELGRQAAPSSADTAR